MLINMANLVRETGSPLRKRGEGVTVLLFIVVLLSFSGCLNILAPDIAPHGKYLANNTDTLVFTDNNVFYATEYMEFTKQTVEFTGTYNVVGTEVILEYKFMGIVRRFEISNDTRTLTEINNGNKGMQFNLVTP